jgi:predicted  nucleic acid-binding Zn-ribbon protein
VEWIAAWIEKIDKMFDAIENAKKAGTLNALDRSRQYTEPTQHELLASLNEAWTKIRTCEKSILAKDAQISQLSRKVGNYRLVNIALTSILTGLAWEGMRALVPWVIAVLR